MIRGEGMGKDTPSVLHRTDHSRVRFIIVPTQTGKGFPHGMGGLLGFFIGFSSLQADL